MYVMRACVCLCLCERERESVCVYVCDAPDLRVCDAPDLRVHAPLRFASYCVPDLN